jgi:hypothetical protein
MSGHEPQMGLDIKTDWETDRLTVGRNVTLTEYFPELLVLPKDARNFFSNSFNKENPAPIKHVTLAQIS